MKPIDLKWPLPILGYGLVTIGCIPLDPARFILVLIGVALVYVAGALV